MMVLPDSRLQDPTKATVMADWPVDGRVIRLELQPVYCFNCGKLGAYVPAGCMSFVSWLCRPCSDTWGEKASLHVSSDREFWQAVGFEMVKRWGRALTEQELFQMAEQGRLGTALEKLAGESPFKGMV